MSKKLQRVSKLFDFVLSGNYVLEKKLRLAENEMNRIFSILECGEASPGTQGPNEIPHVPADNMEEEFEDVFEELSEKKSIKSYIAASMARIITEQENGDNAYQSFFRKKMDQWNVSSPSQLADEDKGSFFTEVEKEWKAKKGVIEGLQGPGGKFGFQGEDGHKGYMGEDSNVDE